MTPNRRFRWLSRVAATLLLAPVAYLLAATVGALLPSGTPAPTGLMTHEIRLIRGPIHYDFLLPATPQTRQMFRFAAADGVPVDHPGAAWLVVGWGAREFYTTVGDYTDLSARAIWRGITGDNAVLRLDVLGPLPAETPSVLRVPVRAAEFDALLTALAEDVTGAAALDHPGFTLTDAFYPAPGRFHIFRTCNAWVGEKLRQSGIKAGRWTPTTFAVTLSLWWSGRSA